MLKRGVDTVAAVLCVFLFGVVRLLQPLAKLNQSAVLQETRFVCYISAVYTYTHTHTHTYIYVHYFEMGERKLAVTQNKGQ
jgi:hypothetical protein